MDCYICATDDTSRQTAAVAICPGCSAGLCLAHVETTARERTGGTAIACNHGTWTPVD
jgi:hypothetical protein